MASNFTTFFFSFCLFHSVQHYLRYQSTSGNTRPEKKLPVSAEIVIAGAGAVGSSVAYHLAKLGWRDVLVLEQGQ